MSEVCQMNVSWHKDQVTEAIRADREKVITRLADTGFGLHRHLITDPSHCDACRLEKTIRYTPLGGSDE